MNGDPDEQEDDMGEADYYADMPCSCCGDDPCTCGCGGAGCGDPY